MFSLKDFLSEAVKPAVGCTEPIAVALAVARAREELGSDDPIVSAALHLSPNVFKNGNKVGIPGTGGLRGNDIAAALAMSVGSSADGLEFFKSVTPEDVPGAQKKLVDGRVHIEADRSKSGIYVFARVHSAEHTADCLIQNSHANIVRVSKDGKEIFNILDNNLDKNLKKDDSKSIAQCIEKMKWEDMLAVLDDIDGEDVDFLLEGVRMNMAISDCGMNNDIGAGIGRRLKASSADFDKADIAFKIKAACAAAADARMGGAQMPVMSSAGSGNHGITAILPAAIFAREAGASKEKLAKALAISHLMTSYIKSRTGKLSSTCGCSFAAGAGSAAAIAWLITEDLKKSAEAAVIMLGNLVGMLCDGAKETCALKVGAGAIESYHAALLASCGSHFDAQGIIGSDIDETVNNAMQVANNMGAIELAILDIVKGRFAH